MAKNFFDDEDEIEVPETEFAPADFDSDAMAEQEFNASKLDEQAMSELEQVASPPPVIPEMPNVMPASAPASPDAKPAPSWLDAYNKYKEAQASRKTSDALALATLGAGQISQGMAQKYGGKVGNNKEGADAIRAMAEGNVSAAKEDLSLTKDADMNDPKSAVSTLYRQQAYALLKKLDPQDKNGLQGNLETMTAEQLQKLPGLKEVMKSSTAAVKTLQQGQFITKTGDPAIFDPNSGKYINAVTGQQVTESGDLYRPVMYNDAFGNRAVMGPQGNIQVSSSKRGPEQFSKMEPKAEAQVAESFSPDAKQREALDEEKKRVDTMVKAANGQIGQINGLLKALDTNSKMAKGVAVNALVRAAGETGPLSESDKAPFQGSSALLDRMNQYLSTNVGSELTAENKSEMKKLIGIYLTTAADTKNGIYNNSSSSLSKIHNIPPTFTRQALGDLKPMSKPQERILEKEKAKDEKKEKLIETGEVERLDPKSGKIAIFDNKTKKFLRFKE